MIELTSLFMHFQTNKTVDKKVKQRTNISDIIFLTIRGVLQGHDGCEGVIDFGNARLDFRKRYDHFEVGLPSEDILTDGEVTTIDDRK